MTKEANELAILGRILLLQSALSIAPDNLKLGELVCYVLSEIPGVSSAVIYIEDILVSRAPSDLRKQPEWPPSWQDAQLIISAESDRLVSLPLQTNKKTYGQIVLVLDDHEKAHGYLPHLENTVNLVALMLENRRQAEELQELNRDLEGQVQERVELLQRSEERLSLALKGANSGIWDWNPQTGKVFYDENYFLMAGYDVDEFSHTYKEWQQRVHPEDLIQAEKAIKSYLTGKINHYSADFRFKTKQGSWMWIHAQGITSERDEFGAPARVTGTHTDINDRKLAEEALRESENRFRHIFQTNPDPVVIMRLEDSVFVDVNRAFEAESGFSKDVVIGKSSAEINLWVDMQQRDLYLDILNRDGEVNNFEAGFRGRSGEIRTTLISSRIMKFFKEPLFMTVIRDITTEKAAERVLVEMDRVKNEFISTAAHELRTPLTAMMGFTELLIDSEQYGGFSREQTQEFLADVYDRGEALSRIIDDLLDISRIESGHSVTLDLQKADMRDVLTKTIEFFQVNGSGHTFQLELPQSTEHSMMLIDRHRINQVLENLLSNAVKYSPKGSEIVVTGQFDTDGWEIKVEDCGIGMTSAQVERIFDKFYRADVSDTAVSGLGLGMSIAKQIVDAHNGSIRVESLKGTGTTVTVNLPSVVK
ncbi:MAG TPA: ATP-binding protein [Geopsychrobacteraceae bacterium]|nr:ATP-binding protein [Geopsychrobacteraceae bacterium]